ncbi:MAG: hypothetical protein HW387_436 [Parachlamydiales bacterium]|nr:hypothetical protein [Parachlamydiales bacterium]
MRYNNLKAFERQIAAASSDQRGRLFLIAQADDFERRKAIDTTLAFVAAPDAFVSRFLGEDATVRAVMDALNSPALFSPECVVVVDDADKKLIDALFAQLKGPLSFGYLLLGVKGKISSSFAETHGIVLDLMEERPWEKEKRWTEKLHEKARAAGKRLAPDAAQWMMERLEKDAAVLDSEMDKLVCYCAHKSSIEKSDVEEICSASRTHTLWQIADEMVWAKIFRSDAADMRDPSFFHGLLPSLRMQLNIGMKMHDLHLSQVPFSEWGAHFPKIWPKTLEKKAQTAQRLGSTFFRDGLDRLFEIELLAKNSAAPLDAMLDFFRVRLMS